MSKIIKKLIPEYFTRTLYALTLYLLCAQAFANSPSNSANKITIKSVDAFHFFYAEIQTKKADLADKIKSKAMDMSIKLSKRSGAKIKGPFMLNYQARAQQSTGLIDAEIGFPVSKRTKRLPPYKYRKAKAFDCASLTFTGAPSQLEQKWRHLYQFTQERQLKLSGESRMLLLSSEENGKINVELQLGISKSPKEREKQVGHNTGSITARLTQENNRMPES